MSKILSSGVSIAGSKYDFVTDLVNNSYFTEVSKVSRDGPRYQKVEVERINLKTSNLTAALRKHDEIIARYSKG